MRGPIKRILLVVCVMASCGSTLKTHAEDLIPVVPPTPEDTKAPVPESRPYTIRLKHRKAVDVERMLRANLPQVKFVADEGLNALHLLGTAEEIAQLEAQLVTIDQPPAQILITATIEERSTTDATRLGVELSPLSVDLQKVLPPEVGRITPTSLTTTILPPGKIHLSDERTQGTIIARPNIMVEQGATATIASVDRVPIRLIQSTVVGGQIASSQTIQFEEVGVKLSVTPILLAEGWISLQIEGEVSSVTGVTAEGFPTISKRATSSLIRLKDGWTARLGGLIRKEKRFARIGLPILSDLPILGGFFSSQRTDEVFVEVVISLTPTIITEQDFSKEKP